MMDDRTVKPVVCPQRGAQHFVIEDDEKESELSLGSRSFLNGVNDQEREKQKRSSFCDMVNVHVCNIGISVIHGQESLRQMAFHQEHKRSHNETNVRHICEIGVRTRWDLWSENNWLGRSSHANCHQSSAHKGLRLLRFCLVSWKDEREPSIKFWMGTKIGVVQKYTGIHNVGRNWWWANGNRVAYLPTIQYVAALSISSRVTVEIKWSTREL